MSSTTNMDSRLLQPQLNVYDLIEIDSKKNIRNPRELIGAEVILLEKYKNVDIGNLTGGQINAITHNASLLTLDILRFKRNGFGNEAEKATKLYMEISQNLYGKSRKNHQEEGEYSSYHDLESSQPQAASSSSSASTHTSVAPKSSSPTKLPTAPLPTPIPPQAQPLVVASVTPSPTKPQAASSSSSASAQTPVAPKSSSPILSPTPALHPSSSVPSNPTKLGDAAQFQLTRALEYFHLPSIEEFTNKNYDQLQETIPHLDRNDSTVMAYLCVRMHHNEGFLTSRWAHHTGTYYKSPFEPASLKGLANAFAKEGAFEFPDNLAGSRYGNWKSNMGKYPALKATP